jgi:hypothetical protein
VAVSLLIATSIVIASIGAIGGGIGTPDFSFAASSFASSARRVSSLDFARSLMSSLRCSGVRKSISGVRGGSALGMACQSIPPLASLGASHGGVCSTITRLLPGVGVMGDFGRAPIHRAFFNARVSFTGKVPGLWTYGEAVYSVHVAGLSTRIGDFRMRRSGVSGHPAAFRDRCLTHCQGG